MYRRASSSGRTRTLNSSSHRRPFDFGVRQLDSSIAIAHIFVIVRRDARTRDHELGARLLAYGRTRVDVARPISVFGVPGPPPPRLPFLLRTPSASASRTDLLVSDDAAVEADPCSRLLSRRRRCVSSRRPRLPSHRERLLLPAPPIHLIRQRVGGPQRCIAELLLQYVDDR